MPLHRISTLVLRPVAALALLGGLTACDPLTLPGDLGSSTGGFGEGLAITRTSVDPSKTSVAPGERLTLSVEAKSPTNASLSYRWRASAGSVSGSGASVTWTAPDSGSATVEVEVSGGGETANAAFRFRVVE